MNEIEEKNAVIESAVITKADHGVLTAWIHLKYDIGGQGFGGYGLYVPASKNHSYNYTGHFIWRVLEIVGVDEWSRLVGKTIRVRAEHDHIHAIGHIIKDDWFYPKDEFKAATTKDD